MLTNEHFKVKDCQEDKNLSGSNFTQNKIVEVFWNKMSYYE